MGSRSLQIEDALEQQLKLNKSAFTRDNSQTVNEQLHHYARINDEQQRLGNNDYSQSSSNTADNGVSLPIEDTEDFDREDPKNEYSTMHRSDLVQRRFADFSEVSPKEFSETTSDEWYASASDQEETTVPVNPYSREAVNPVLECVNQILIQQSMEEAPNSVDTECSKRKRVHFSTRNNVEYVPQPDDDEHVVQRQQILLHYQPIVPAVDASHYESIDSNKYEPIGSERDSNLYVDMTASLTDLSPIHKPPPALPPKPANLLKFKKSFNQLKEPIKDENDCSTSIISATEPDYCSISDVVVKSVPLAYVNKKLVQKVEANEIEEILADIPKLPNVAAIIAPKESASDYLIMTPKTAQAPRSPQFQSQSDEKCKHVPIILTEINRRISKPNFSTMPKRLPSTPPPKTMMCPIADYLDDMPIQAEFDWYNLDVEYDQSQGSSINLPDDGFLEKICNDNDGLISAADEYNLDEEFQQEPPLMEQK